MNFMVREQTCTVGTVLSSFVNQLKLELVDSLEIVPSDEVSYQKKTRGKNPPGKSAS